MKPNILSVTSSACTSLLVEEPFMRDSTWWRNSSLVMIFAGTLRLTGQPVISERADVISSTSWNKAEGFCCAGAGAVNSASRTRRTSIHFHSNITLNWDLHGRRQTLQSRIHG